MSTLIVCPLSRLAETATRLKADSVISLLAEGHAFHRPAERHLVFGFNDIHGAQKGLVHPQEAHVAKIVAFARAWNRAQPLLIHCWMGISRSPAAGPIAALALEPDQDEDDLATRLRHVAPTASPNVGLIAIADCMLGLKGALARAIHAIGRGAQACEGEPFLFPLRPEAAHDA